MFTGTEFPGIAAAKWVRLCLDAASFAVQEWHGGQESGNACGGTDGWLQALGSCAVAAPRGM